jgi:hypothetical protein
MRRFTFGQALPAGTRLTLFSVDKPDRFFTVIKFWVNETSGVALGLKTGISSDQVEDEEGRTHLLIHLPIEEENENRWCLWRPDQRRPLTSLFCFCEAGSAARASAERYSFDPCCITGRHFWI